uniref:Uncharacterized protein n=1 Tax=Romanomermis culicivorax TaxID=13658 RepID=A0A915KI12_ROMCU
MAWSNFEAFGHSPMQCNGRERKRTIQMVTSVNQPPKTSKNQGNLMFDQTKNLCPLAQTLKFFCAKNHVLAQKNTGSKKHQKSRKNVENFPNK